MITASYVRDLKGWKGDAKLYTLSNGNHVVVSTVWSAFPLSVSPAGETLIFEADADGDVTKWNELPGSEFEHALEPETAIQRHLDHLNGKEVTE